jgi:hypothetical protein
MSYRFGVVLGGVVLAVAGLVVGGAGAAGAAPDAPPMTCPPVLPVSGAASAVTSTGVTISYSIFLGPPCGYDPPVTVTLFASHDDAQQWVDPVGEAVSGPERTGQLAVGGLAPDTVYWFRFSADGRRDPYVFGSVRTAPVPVCVATAHVDSAWGGGFVATVAVRNVGSGALGSWHVRWPGKERIEAVWTPSSRGTPWSVTRPTTGLRHPAARRPSACSSRAAGRPGRWRSAATAEVVDDRGCRGDHGCAVGLAAV